MLRSTGLGFNIQRLLKRSDEIFSLLPLLVQVNAKKSPSAVKLSINEPKAGSSVPEVKQVKNSHLVQEAHQKPGVASESQVGRIKVTSTRVGV